LVAEKKLSAIRFQLSAIPKITAKIIINFLKFANLSLAVVKISLVKLNNKEK